MPALSAATKYKGKGNRMKLHTGTGIQLVDTENVHIGWDREHDEVLLSLITDDEILTLRMRREVVEDVLMPSVMVALSELGSLLAAAVTAAANDQTPTHEPPRHGRLPDGGIWAVMCDQCSTLGGHSSDCPLLGRHEPPGPVLTGDAYPYPAEAHEIKIWEEGGVHYAQCACPPWTVPAVFSTREGAELFSAGHLTDQEKARAAAAAQTEGEARRSMPGAGLFQIGGMSRAGGYNPRSDCRDCRRKGADCGEH